MPFLFKVYNEPEGPEFPPSIPWTETFTGTDGSDPNDVYWTKSGQQNAQIQNNEVRLTCTTAGSDLLALNYGLGGDFIITVDWSMISGFSSSSGWATLMQVQVDNNNKITIYQSGNTVDPYIVYATWLNGSRQNNLGPTWNTSGKFRVRRVGSTWYGDYDIGGGWVNKGSRNIGTADITHISLQASNWSTRPTRTCSFDNFTITQGTPIG